MPAIFLLLSFLMYTSCDEYNSNSADRLKYGGDPQQEVDTGDANFSAAFPIIQQKCISCHSGDHNNWAGYTSDEKWLNSGLINRGDPDNSSFIKRIINSGGPNANMPEGLGALPDSEYQLLRKWIAEMP